MPSQPNQQRVTFSPGEFAALFGKSQTWGYRQIYAGKVKTITEYGRIQIPAAEVERILASAERYEGTKRAATKTKAELQELAPKLQNAWQNFVNRRRESKKRGAVATGKSVGPPPVRTAQRDSRKEVLRRLVRKSSTA